VVIEEGTRMQATNEALSREIDRLKAELARVQSELAASKDGEKMCVEKLSKVNQTLDQIERQMQAVGTALLRINFGFSSSKFEPTPEIGEALIAAGRTARRVNVRGHSDKTGTVEANRLISLARAVSVRKYLIANGIAKNKIFVSSKGFDEPLGDNSTDEGRAKNRRADVEFIR
jgi:outer membrane protein OmpA-like peptidoglycan-associated protein